MQRNVDSIRLDEEEHYWKEGEGSFKCGECGGTFEKPLWATDSSNGNVEEYYACPRCMTKVNYRRTQSGTPRESGISVEEHEIASEKPADDLGCNHFLGYLKKRAKNMPIPDECLTCSRMVECMLH
jgi:DNA-directed RNA polymerase subunit RPC12/RpoP